MSSFNEDPFSSPYDTTIGKVVLSTNETPSIDMKKINDDVNKISRTEDIAELEKKRTILSLTREFPDKHNIPKYFLGLVIYILIFVMVIPYIMIKNKVPNEILLGYMPNVDIIATILGYDGGPFANIWRYLYNPSNFTIFGFANVTIINYMALLGVTFVIAKDTYENRSWEYGWAGAFVCLLMTYLLPGNPIVIAQNKVESTLERFGINDNNAFERYIMITTVGLTMAILLVITEAIIIKISRPHIVSAIKNVTMWLKK